MGSRAPMVHINYTCVKEALLHRTCHALQSTGLIDDDMDADFACDKNAGNTVRFCIKVLIHSFIWKTNTRNKTHK